MNVYIIDVIVNVLYGKLLIVFINYFWIVFVVRLFLKIFGKLILF